MAFFEHCKAITTRAIFAIHGLIAIWRTADVKQTAFWWILAIPIFGLLMESLFTIIYRKGLEWKWYVARSQRMFACPTVRACTEQ